MAKLLGTLPSDLKESNRRRILDAFYKKKVLSALEIAADTGISRQTVKKCIDYFLSVGVLEKCGKGDSTVNGGKKPDLYQLHSGIRVLSVCLHHDNLELSLFSVTGVRLAFWASQKLVFNSLDSVMQCLHEGWQCIAKENTEGSVLALGMSAPLGFTQDYHVVNATPFPVWPKKDYCRDIREELRVAVPGTEFVVLSPDGTAAGASLLQRDYDTFAHSTCVTFYTASGIGGSVFKDSVAQSGRLAPLGSLGHMIVEPRDPEACFCGNHGCLERQVSIARLRQHISRDPEAYKDSIVGNIPVEQLTYGDVFRGSHAGDWLCQKESQRCAQYFAIAVNNLILSIWPDYVVFQGEFAGADEIFRKELQSRVSSMKMLTTYEGRICYDNYPLNESEALGIFYRTRETLLENLVNVD